MPKLFISHTHSDEEIAKALDEAIRTLFGSVFEVEYSTKKKGDGGIPHGDHWFHWIVDQVINTDVAFVLLTPRSIQKPWITWEAGAVEGIAMAYERKADNQGFRSRKVRPLAFNFNKSNIPSPFRRIHVLNGDSKQDMKMLFHDLFELVGEMLDHKDAIKFGHMLESTIETYLERVSRAMEQTPLCLPGGAINVVIYMPLLHLNPFFSTFLEWFCEGAQRMNFNVIVRKGHYIYQRLDRRLDVFLEEIKNSTLEQSIIVVFPPHPNAYRELSAPQRIADFHNLNVILMDIDPLQVEECKEKLLEAEYIKAVIVLDNQKACKMAAEAVIGRIQGKFDYVKVILCDGEYHGRAEMFRDAMSELSKKATKADGSEGGILVEYLPTDEPIVGQIKFSSALKDTYLYVTRVIDKYLGVISICPTYIFCANDVIALGARSALDKFPKEKMELVHIITYDGSSLLEEYVNMDDPYIDILLSQNYREYTDTLLNEIRELVTQNFSEKRIDKVKRIDPTVRVSL